MVGAAKKIKEGEAFLVRWEIQGVIIQGDNSIGQFCNKGFDYNQLFQKVMIMKL